MKTERKIGKLLFATLLLAALLSLAFGSESSFAAVASESGTKTQNGLVTESDGYTYYYVNSVKKSGWVTIGKKTYYFYKTSHGSIPAKAMVTDAVVKIGEYRYYFDSEGIMQTGWITYNKSTYYFYKTAHGEIPKGAAVTGLIKISGYRYYFSTAGKMKTGWRTVNGNTYYFGSNGRAKTGWQTIGSNKYCFSGSGKMLKDCWKDGYYLLSDGTIAKNQQVPDGYYVDANGKKIELSGIQSTITSMISSYGGTWSVYVKNLESGDVLSINDCAMYPASTIKVFVMASLYNEIAAGRISETSQITSLLNSMITVSSNEAYNELVRRQSSSGSSFLSGAAVVNKYLKANGYSSTGVHHTLHPSSSSSTSDGSKNVSSAKDCGVLLENIYNGTCVSKAYSQKMLNLLLAQERRWKIPAGIPSGIKVANKTGETSTTQHDIAIVYGEKTDYVICVFSSGCSEYTAVNGIKNISKTIYNYLN